MWKTAHDGPTSLWSSSNVLCVDCSSAMASVRLSSPWLPSRECWSLLQWQYITTVLKTTVENTHGCITIIQTCLWNHWVYCVVFRSFCCELTVCVLDIHGYAQAMGCRLDSGAYPGLISDPETLAPEEDHRSSHCHHQRMSSAYIHQNKQHRNKTTFNYCRGLGGQDTRLMLNQCYKKLQTSDT